MPSLSTIASFEIPKSYGFYLYLSDPIIRIPSLVIALKMLKTISIFWEGSGFIILTLILVFQGNNCEFSKLHFFQILHLCGNIQAA